MLQHNGHVGGVMRCESITYQALEFLDCRFTVPVAFPRPARERSQVILREAAAVLSAFEQQYRQELPATPPPFCPPAGAWAAALFHPARQFAPT